MKLRNLLLMILAFFFASNASAQIIFETDFANDGDYFDTGTGFIRFTDLPEGFDGIRTNQGTISGAPGEGVGGSVALKFEWPVTTTPLAVSLFKHLTGKKNTGYKEVYVRYRVRLPNNFRAGTDGSPLPYWKWGRLWQNSGAPGEGGWGENRTDSYFIVWNWGNGLPTWGIRNGLVFGENLNTNTKGSAGSPRGSAQWYNGVSGDGLDVHINEPGMWDHVSNGAWKYNHATRELADNKTQGWHTFEWRFKLSTTDTSNDGTFQVWFDGVEQIPPRAIDNIDQPVDKPHTTNSLVTAAKPGMNLLTLFDNMSQWSKGWGAAGVEGGIYINDLVISTTRIGHNYYVGDPPPKPPSGVTAK